MLLLMSYGKEREKMELSPSVLGLRSRGTGERGASLCAPPQAAEDSKNAIKGMRAEAFF